MPLPKRPSVKNEFRALDPGSSLVPGPSQDRQTSEADWQNTTYDPRTKKLHVGEFKLDVSKHVYPTARVFSDGMPAGWEEAVMGFRDNWEVRDDSDEEEDDRKDRTQKGTKSGRKITPRFPREQYVRMWIACDEEVYNARLGATVKKVKKLLSLLERRQTESVISGAAGKKVDDMLEYAVRLATGTSVAEDENLALHVLREVIGGQFPEDKVAIANNMMCHLYKKRFIREGNMENFASIFLFADHAAATGPFTHCISTLTHFFSPVKKDQPCSPFTTLWAKYEEFKEKWGLIDAGQVLCAVCGIKPTKTRKLKRCTGTCPKVKKPLYCGIGCQRKHWPTHKRWCRKDPTPTESDRESDAYYEDNYFTSVNKNDYDSEDDEEGDRYTSDDKGTLNEDHNSDDRTTVTDPKPSHKQVSKENKDKRYWSDYGDLSLVKFVVYLAMSVVRSNNS